MTAGDAWAQAVAAPRGERLHLFETVCVPRGACRRELLTDQRSRPLDVVSRLLDALRRLRNRGQSDPWVRQNPL